MMMTMKIMKKMKIRDCTSVYFVKYETKITFDTEDDTYAKDIRDMHNKLRSEVLTTV